MFKPHAMPGMDPGEEPGHSPTPPPLFSHQIEAQRAEKIMFWDWALNFYLRWSCFRNILR